MLKKSLILAAILISLAATGAFALNILVTVHNLSGYNLSSMYITPIDSNTWGDNLVGNQPLSDGQSMDVTFSIVNNDWTWDMQATDTQGDTVEWKNLNLQNATNIYLWVDQNGTAEVKVYGN